MNRISLPLVVALLAACVGCAALEKALTPGSPNAAVVNAGIEFATVKAVQSSKNPAATAAIARDVLTQVNSALTSGNVLSATLDTLDARVQAILASRHLAPEDAILFDTIRQAVYTDLSGHISSSANNLKPADVAAIEQAIADIQAGIKLAGY